MPVFGAGFRLDFSGVLKGLRAVRNAVSSLMAMKAPRAAPGMRIGNVLGAVRQLSQMMAQITKPGAVPGLGAISTRLPGKAIFGAKNQAILDAAMKQFRAAFDARNLGAMRAAIKSLPEHIRRSATFIKASAPVVSQAIMAMRKHNVATDEYTRAMRELVPMARAVRTQFRRQVYGGIAGKIPIIGRISGAVGIAQGRLAEIQTITETLKEAGKPVGYITTKIAELSAVLPVIGTVLSTFAKIGVAIVKASIGVVRFGFSLAKLPFTVLWKVHRAIQSMMFSLSLFIHLFERFFGAIIGIVKNVQIATVVATGSLDTYGETLEYVVELSSRYAISTDEIAAALVKVSKAGFATAEAQDILGATIKHATIFGGELVQVVDQTITVIRAWGKEASESDAIIRSLNYAVSRSKLSIQALSTALGYAAASAASSGIAFEDTLAVMAKLVDQGLRASRAGMAFRTFVAGLDRAISHAAGGAMNLDKAIKVLGIDFAEYGGEAIDLMGVLSELTEIVQDGVNAQERMALMVIFGRRYYAQLIKLFEVGADEIKNFSDAIKEGAETEKLAVLVSSRLVGVIQRLKNLFKAFKLAILGEMSEPLKDMNDIMGEAFKLADRFGKKLGELGRAKIIRPLVDFFKMAFAPEQIKEYGKVFGAVSKRMDFWLTRLSKAGAEWVTTVAGPDAKRGLLGIVDVLGVIAEQSLKISGVIISTFQKLDFDHINSIIKNIAASIRDYFPGILEKALNVLEWILKYGDIILEKIIGVEPVIKKIEESALETIKLVHAGIGKMTDEETDKLFKKYQGLALKISQEQTKIRGEAPLKWWHFVVPGGRFPAAAAVITANRNVVEATNRLTVEMEGIAYQLGVRKGLVIGTAAADRNSGDIR